MIEAKYEGGTMTFTDEAIASLPTSSPGDRQIGRLNPSFGLGELEGKILDSMFESLSNWLEVWTIHDGTIVDTYAIKELKPRSLLCHFFNPAETRNDRPAKWVSSPLNSEQRFAY